MCFSPCSIQNPSSTDTKNRLSVPCGKCYACKMNKRIEWTFRLYQELVGSLSAYFVTLTYADSNIPTKVDKSTGEILNVLRKADLQTFIKNLRYYSKFRYFAVGEYGEQFKRPHYHLLIFNLERKAAQKIGDIWKHGSIHIGKVEMRSIHYCTKDMMKDVKFKSNGGVDAFRIMSTKPAIGSRYLEYAMSNKLRSDFTVFLNGFKISMPRYYREKVFNIKQKEEHQNLMIKEADRQFHEYVETCEKKGIKNPFKYLEKERKALYRQQQKSLKQRKL